MTFGWPITLPSPRSLENVDTLTGTPEADNFKLEPPGFGTLYDFGLIDLIDWSLSNQPGLQSLDDDFIPVDIDFANNLIALGIPTIVDLSEDTEVDLLVYQVADGPEYFPGFTDPLASSYILIENFDPIEDQIFVDGGKGYVRIMSDENDIPMTDDVQPAFVYNPSNPIFAFG